MMRLNGSLAHGLIAITILAGVSMQIQGFGAAASAGDQVTFSGMVVDVQGRPVAGATVGFYEIDSGGLRLSYTVKTLHEFVTGAAGTFSYDVPMSSDYQSVIVLARKQGLAIGWAFWPRRGDRQYDIVLGAPKTLGGIVVDEDGGPVADAEVFIAGGLIGKDAREGENLTAPVSRRLLQAKTDASGRFRFTDLPGDATFELGAEKPGYATFNSFPTLRGYREVLQYTPGQSDIGLVMPVEAVVGGTVVERENGRPASGVMLQVRASQGMPMLQPAPVATADDGTFRVGGLPPETYTVSLAAPERGLADWVAAPVDVTVAAGQTKSGVRIELDEGGLLEVRVTEAGTSQPITGAYVGIRDERRGRWLGAISDANGVARTRLLPGTYQMQGASKQGYDAPREVENITIERGVTKRLARMLTETPRIRGVVRDPGGKPVEGVSLELRPAWGGGTESDAEGKFEMVWDQRGWPGEDTVFCLVARHAERNLAVGVEIGDAASGLELALKPGITFTGRVVDSEGKAIAGAKVSPMLHVSNWGAPLDPEGIEADTEGRFEIGAIPPDHRYNVNVWVDGYGRASVDADAHDAVNGRLDVGALTLPLADLSISGRVVDTQGRPVPHVLVEGYGEGQPNNCRTESDAEGRFVLDGVCAGKINLRVRVGRGTNRLSAHGRTFGDVTDIRIVVREGRSPTQYWGSKTYEQIVGSAAKVIAGVAVDEQGAPVAGVPVGVCCHKRKRENDKFSWMFASFEALRATTDDQGRFAIELEEDGEYNLRFSPDHHAAVIVYDLPVGKKDLKVTLPDGGTVVGRLVRWEKGRKVPISNAAVKLEQPDRTSYTHLGFDRDRTTTTDAEGRFCFEHIRTKVRPGNSRTQTDWEHVPRVWNLAYGDISQTVVFSEGTTLDDVELLVKPSLDQASPLEGDPLPDVADLGIDSSMLKAEGKAILVCFFDMQQRPARHCLMQLVKRAADLERKGVVVVAVQASAIAKSQLDEWADNAGIPFPIGMLGDDAQDIRAIWAAKSLPWLILTDKQHTVISEGLALDDLSRQLERSGDER